MTALPSVRDKSGQTTASATPQPPKSLVWPMALCWVVVMLDGFDLVVLGAAIPTLTGTGAIGFTNSGATWASSLTYVGAAVGAAGVGFLTSRFGRRKVIIGCVALFSVLTLLLPFAPNVAVFAALRMIAGLGLGAVVPTCLAYMGEINRANRTARVTTITMTGYHVGAVLTTLLTLWFLPYWQAPFAIGGLFGLLLVPVLILKLPESPVYFLANAHAASQQKRADSGVSELFRDRSWTRTTLATWIACFMGLIIVFGLNTWLPQIMSKAGYAVTDSIIQLFVLNLGAIVGLVFAGWIGDKWKPSAISTLWFLMAATLLVLLSARINSVFLLGALIFFAGVFVFSAQVMVYAFISKVYEGNARGTAMGLGNSIGRLGAIVGPLGAGILVTANLAYPWGFYLFAGAAFLGLVSMLLIPRKIRESA
ncbi:MFS transporter [Corynebacterium hylobatis]|uniref:MFS transporter n=1 Tax=Corynebacterium hylobatis TaxID=1859290 RepID=A0A3S0BH89_9CORY|nr:aromatic acid/H+ symport family MFS transporter [Corynebacterium hylobatis]RSZ62852.1 MFS transporter [Corynebacterium hylobatis]